MEKYTKEELINLINYLDFKGEKVKMQNIAILMGVSRQTAYEVFKTKNISIVEEKKRLFISRLPSGHEDMSFKQIQDVMGYKDDNLYRCLSLYNVKYKKNVNNKFLKGDKNVV